MRLAKIHPDARPRHDRPADVLTCPLTGREVWVRDLFNDGGAAYEIVRRDPEHTCPRCDGAGSYDVELPARHSAQVVPDERTDRCPTCAGSGVVEALYGWADDDSTEATRLLWPVDSDDAEDSLYL